MTALSDTDRRMIAKAREVAALKTADSMRERYGDSDGEMARAAALGEAEFLLLELVAIIERPGGEGAEDTRRLNAVRGVLAWFDWEHDDRQLALEKIERIVEGGQV